MHELKLVRVRRQAVFSEPLEVASDGGAITYLPRSKIGNSGDLYLLFHKRFEQLDREEFIAVLLDGKSRSMGFNVVSVGALTASIVHPREVCR